MDRDEMTAWLQSRVAYWRGRGDTARMDDLLDKLANVDDLIAFLQITDPQPELG